MARLYLLDLSPGQEYKVQARAKNDELVSEWSQIFTFATPADVIPPAPITSLSWTSVGTAFKGTWTAPTTNADTSPLRDFADFKVTVYSPAAPGTTAIFYVREPHFDLSFEQNVNAFGTPRAGVTIEVQARDDTGNMSTVVSATATNPAPATPANLAATATYDSIAVKWDRVADTDLKYYELYTNPTNSNTGGSLVYRGADNTYNHTTVAYTTDIYFYVLAVDVFNTPSAASSALGPFRPKNASTVDVTAPASVTGVAAASTATTEGPAATVSFNRNTESDVDFYTVRYSTSASGPWQYVDVPQQASGSTLSVLVRGLVPNTSYYFGVAVQDFSANRTAYTNASSYPVTISGNTTAPAQVTGVASYEQFNALTVYWTENSETDVKWGAGTYEVQVATDSGFTTNLKTVNTGATSASVSGMVSGQTAHIRVRARNSSGTYGTYSTTITNAIGQPADDIPTNTLSADVLKANTAILSNLTINNDVPNGRFGSIQSSDYNGSSTGWKLSSNGLDVFTGTIRAASLQIQSGNNLMPPQYADFEFRTDFYAGGTTLAGTATGISATAANFKFNTQSLQFNANGTLYLGTSTTNYNVILEPSTTYIISYYGRLNSGSATLTPSITTNTPTTFNGSAQAQTGTFTRYSFSFTTGAGDTSGVVWFTASGAGVAQVDGIQIEAQTGGLTTPSQWKPPGSTRVDGGIIRTGEIRSSALSTVGDTTQPAWSINVAGNAQLNDVIVRGKIVVGASGNGFNSSIAMASWNYGGSGSQWSIFGDGTFSLKSGSTGSTVTLANTGLTGNDGTANVYNSGRPGGETFALLNTGSLYLSGTINAVAGVFTGNVQITTGSLFAGSSATSGKRLKMDSTALSVYTAASTNLFENSQSPVVLGTSGCATFVDYGVTYAFCNTVYCGDGTNGSYSYGTVAITSTNYVWAQGGYVGSAYAYSNVDTYAEIGVYSTDLASGANSGPFFIPAHVWTRVWVVFNSSGVWNPCKFIVRPPASSAGQPNNVAGQIWYAGFQFEASTADNLPTALVLQNMRGVTTSTGASSLNVHTRAANTVVAGIANDGTGQLSGSIHQASLFDGVVYGILRTSAQNNTITSYASGSGYTVYDRTHWKVDSLGLGHIMEGPRLQGGTNPWYQKMFYTDLTVTSPSTLSGVATEQWSHYLYGASASNQIYNVPSIAFKSDAVAMVSGTPTVDTNFRGEINIGAPGKITLGAANEIKLTSGTLVLTTATGTGSYGLEIGYPGACLAGTVSFIDFHRNTNAGLDFDARIIVSETASGSTGQATMNLIAGSVQQNGRRIPIAATGSDTATFSGAASGQNMGTQSFGITFPAVPKVCVTQSNLPSGSGKMVGHANNITTTGFDLYVYTGDGTAMTATNVSFDWIAIYQG